MILKSIYKYFNLDKEAVPYGVRVLTNATALRWFGWGIAESLIPIFIFSLGKSYSESALINASFDIVFIISLTLFGFIGDRVKSTILISIGLFLYIFVGLGYFLAGLTGAITFVIFARITNGLSYALDIVGRHTYFRRHVEAKKTAIAFGYFDTIANFGWVIGALFGIVLVKHFSITELLLVIAPTSLVGLLITLKLRHTEKITKTEEVIFEKKFTFKNIFSWSTGLKSVIILNFFISLLVTAVTFFLPIEAYNKGASLSQVILIGIAGAIPVLFGFKIGKILSKNGIKLLNKSLILFSFLIFSLSLSSSYAWIIFVYFAVSIILEVISVASNHLISVFTPPEHFSDVDGIVGSITSIGAMSGPILVGAMFDVIGIKTTYLLLSCVMLFISFSFLFIHKKNKLNVSGDQSF